MTQEQEFVRVKIGGLLWHVRADALESVKPVCADVESAIASAPKLYKNSANVTVASIPGARPLVIRRMNYGRLRHRLKDFFRASRARRAFDRGMQLERAGIPTPSMLAVAEVRRLRWPVAAYLVVDEVPHPRRLSGWLRDPGVDLHRVVKRLASVVGNLHERGFVHRDLKSSNVLLDRDLNPWLIDMDGARFVGGVSLRQAARDLRVLAGPLKERPDLWRVALRFLVCYCRHRRIYEQCRAIARLVA